MGGSDTFCLANPGLTRAWVNWHNSRQVCNLDNLSTSRKWTFEFSTQELRHNSQGGHEKACSWWCLFRLRAVMEGEEGLGPRTSKVNLPMEQLTWWSHWEGSDKETCHTMDPRSRNEEAGPRNKVCHMVQGWWNDEWPQVSQTRDNMVGFCDNDPTVTWWCKSVR
jgi:hypothetical protein